VKSKYHSRSKNAAQQCVQWAGGYAARFQAFFVAFGFLRFDGESHPTHLPLTLTVGRLAQSAPFLRLEVNHGEISHETNTAFTIDEFE
jgi:hypothetical protein